MTVNVTILPPLDLHQLANMPGAGRAHAELKRRGLWDDLADAPISKYRVRVEGEIDVKARSPDEAAEIALEDICGHEIEAVHVAALPEPRGPRR